jgi:3-hydroxyisobutyrate dehydrogenase
MLAMTINACPTPFAQAGPIGFIGIGNMGFAMMARLLSQAWTVFAHDIEPMRVKQAAALGANLCASPADMALKCRISFIVVVDAQQVQSVLSGPLGLFSQSQPGDVVFLCPTLGPLDVEMAADAAKAKGVFLIDCPMSGGPVRAREGQMSLMLAGDSDVLIKNEALLNAITTHRFVIGQKPGDAAKTKLANNLLAAINLAGASEVLAMAQAWGLNAQTTLNVMQASSGQSWIGQDRMERALQNDFEPRAHTSLLAKDTRLALEACAHLKVSVPALGQVASQQFAKACEMGFLNHDDASLFLMAGGQPIKP